MYGTARQKPVELPCPAYHIWPEEKVFPHLVVAESRERNDAGHDDDGQCNVHV
jgi:hypothetical protein